MYNITLEKDIVSGLRAMANGVQKIATTPVVDNQEDAELFVEGIKTINKMPADKFEKIKDLTAEEVVKGLEEEDVSAYIHIMSKALGSTNDALQGKAGRNEFLNERIAVEKALHNESLTDTARAAREVDQSFDFVQSNQFDTTWVPFYVPRNVMGAQEMIVRDITGDTKFVELERGEEPKPSGIGRETDQRLPYRIYGGALLFEDYEIANSVLSVNDHLSYLRSASVRTKSWVAMKEIQMIKADTKHYSLQEFYNQPIADNKDQIWKDVANARYTLNHAAYQMKLEAGQVPEDITERPKHKIEARLDVSVFDPVYVLYNPAHYHHIDLLRNMIRGEDGINPSLAFPFIFLPSYMAAHTGGFTPVAGEEKTKDQWGTRTVVKERTTKNEIGVHLILPGRRNQWGNFSNLAFGRDRREASETTLISARERYLFAKDVRQTCTVTLFKKA